MVKIECTVRFVTPAFLGGADQSGQWRTPPFKALLRQWWRVAEVGGRAPEVSALHAREGELFGRAADQGTTSSQVRLRMDWRCGTVGREKWNTEQAIRFANVQHPEVRQPVGTALYLGYGPVGVGNKLKRQSVLGPGEPRPLKLGIPETEKKRFHDVLRLAHAFGSLGGRSRNGWGSLHFDEGGIAQVELAELLDPRRPAGRDWLRQHFARDWREALDTDWCHAAGKDGRGLLLWRTPRFAQWEEVLQLLAEVKIAFRTQFHFGGGGPHGALCDRQVIAYPITKHNLGAWGGDRRSSNQILMKVLPVDGGFGGLVAHLPHGVPEPLRDRLPENDKANLRRREENVWSQVHKTLNDKLQRLP